MYALAIRSFTTIAIGSRICCMNIGVSFICTNPSIQSTYPYFLLAFSSSSFVHCRGNTAKTK
jgi:hypothetical protein